MISSKKTIWFLLSILTLAYIVRLASATVEQFTVPNGREVTRDLELVEEDRVFINFHAVGPIGFSIMCPNGTSKEFGSVAEIDVRFVCVNAGKYVMHFSNSASESRLVTLDYEVQHFVFGMPQTFFLTIIIAVICVCAVAVFVMMGKRH